MKDKLFNLMRPQSLVDVKGHKVVTDKVKRWIKSDSIPSFILMYGCRGCGKTTVARILSKVANCDNPNEDGPCGECPSCKQAALGINPDILELDAASRNKVEDVKALTEKLGYLPFFKKKVVILDEVHRLSATAFDSLLKTLEEPPENVIFIFCTTELQKIPDTIVSRARKLEFNSLPTPVIAERLSEICKNYDKPYEEAALLAIAKASGGAMRDAINNLEDFFEIGITEENVLSELGLAGEQVILSMIEGMCEGSWEKSVLNFRKEVTKGMRLQSFIDSVISVCLDLMQANVTNTVTEISGTDAYKEMVLKISGKVSFVKLSEICNAFSKIRPIGLDAIQIEGLITSLLIEESSVERLRKQVEELTNRINALENGKISSRAAVISTEPVNSTISEELPFDEESPLDELESVPFDQPADTAKVLPEPDENEQKMPDPSTLQADENEEDSEIEEEVSECDCCPYIDECTGDCIQDKVKNIKEGNGEKTVANSDADTTKEETDESEDVLEAPDADDFFSSLARLF